MREAFAIIDKDNDGLVSKEDLKKVLRELGMNINDEGIEDMIKEADKNGDGNVDVEGFLSVMNSF